MTEDRTLKIGMVVRPHADASEMEALRAEVRRLREAGHAVAPRVTFEAGDGARFARELAREACDLLLAVGGDGTVNEVVNGVAEETWQPRLGVVPTGTANDFAAGMGIPEEMEEAVEVAVHGRAVEVDVARANARYFVNVSTGGFGAEATEATSAETKRLFGPLAYLITGVKEFVELHPTEARFEIEGESLYEGPFVLFAVGNARQTGGGSVLTPRASFGDGLLDVLVVPELPRMEFLGLLPELRAGTHVDSPHVLYRQTPWMRVESERPLSVNADGEPLHGREFEYRLVPRPLSVMVP